MLNEIYDYTHNNNTVSLKKIFFLGKYDLIVDTYDKRIELLDYIEQHLDQLDTMPKTELAAEELLCPGFDMCLCFYTDRLFKLFNAEDYALIWSGEECDDEENLRKIEEHFYNLRYKEYAEPFKNDCLKLVQLLSEKYHVCRYSFDIHKGLKEIDDYDMEFCGYSAVFYIYLKCK